MSIRKALVLILCIVLIISLCGCEAGKISEAKKYIDELYDYTMKKADAEIELESCTVDHLRRVLTAQIENYEKLIEFRIDDIADIYEELSEKGRKKIDDYSDEVADRYLSSIWSN